MNNVLTSPERPQAFSHGDQIQIRQFDALHYAHLPDLGPVTLTVTRAESGRLTVTTVEGDVYTLAAPVGETPGQHHDILTLHPWERLAARFPAALRLDPVAGEGVTLSVTVGAGRDFVPVGHLRADGEAEIDARSSGLLEEALMVLADAEGMDWGLLGGGEGPVCAWIRVWHRDGSLWTPSGHAPQVWLALARAMRLALDTMDAPPAVGRDWSASPLSPPRFFAVGSHVCFTAHAPPPFSNLRGQTFTVAGVSGREVDGRVLTLHGLPLPRSQPSPVEVPESEWAWLADTPEWPVLAAAYPKTFRLVRSRRKGKRKPDAVLHVGRWHGNTFGSVSRADVFGGEIYPHSRQDEFEIEAALRGLLDDTFWEWMIREHKCDPLEHDSSTFEASVTMRFPPEWSGNRPSVTITGHAESVMLALARALRLTVDVNAAFAALGEGDGA